MSVSREQLHVSQHQFARNIFSTQTLQCWHVPSCFSNLKSHTFLDPTPIWSDRIDIQFDCCKMYCSLLNIWLPCAQQGCLPVFASLQQWSKPPPPLLHGRVVMSPAKMFTWLTPESRNNSENRAIPWRQQLTSSRVSRKTIGLRKMIQTKKYY